MQASLTVPGGKLTLTIAVGLFSASACSSSSETTHNTPQDACSVYGAMVGERARICFRSSIAVEADTLAAQAKAACVSALALEGTGATDEGIRACAAAVRSAPCQQDLAVIPSCRMPPGKLADGAACVESVQCSSSLCEKSDGASCGVCAPRAAIGAACTFDNCVLGARCDGATMTCVAVVTSALGGPCGSATGPLCEVGTFCDGASCRAVANAGESCAAAPCASWMRCDETSRTCVAVTIVSEGQSCGGTAICGAGLFCEGHGRCVRLTAVPPGGDCSRDFSVCERGRCTATPTGRQCPTFIADGAACSSGSALEICEPGASCVDGKCQRPEQIVCK